MTRENTFNVAHLFKLTDDEAVTLRRIAFGEADPRSLRRVDVARLLKLRLIAEGRSDMVLTASGKEHVDSLPRAIFSASPRRRSDH
jgi:hypothetical protein